MQWFSFFAVYFIIWWLTLFAVLPFGLKTQAEASSDIVPGTVESAPARFRGRRVFLMTSLVSAIVYGVWYVLSVHYGLGLDSFPQFVPDFD
jgi:predicted secreted protein